MPRLCNGFRRILSFAYYFTLVQFILNCESML